MSNEYFKIDLPGYAPLEVILVQPDDFLKVRETLTRIGVASRKDKILFQSCHILQRQGIIGWYDPLAQSFLVDDEVGVFLTRCDVDRKSTRLNSSHDDVSRMPSSA